MRRGNPAGAAGELGSGRDADIFGHTNLIAADLSGGVSRLETNDGTA